MRVNEMIIKSILTTLGAIALLFAFMLVMLIGLFPSTMMEITYDLGMDASSIRYAERAYDWSNDEYFMAHAMEVAIGMKNVEKIDECGEKLISDGEFSDYCTRKNQSLPAGVTMTYEQYVYGQVCVAKYKSGKKIEAVNRAVELLVGFPENNALVAVLYSALAQGDMETIVLINEKMVALDVSSFTIEEQTYYQSILSLIHI